MSRARKRASKTAIDLIERLEIVQAPIDVHEIARKLKIEIKYTPENNTEISGFFFREGDKSIIGVNASQHDARQRFTIAHEIGHALLHNMQGIHVDKKYRNNLSSQGIDLEEIEANAFAAELLMPADFIKRDVARNSFFDLIDPDEAIEKFAMKYRVSTQAMTIRLSNLGYLEI